MHFVLRCKHFVYVDVESFDIARGELGYIMEFEEKVDTQVFPDDTITEQLGTLDMAFLDPSQVNIQYFT